MSSNRIESFFARSPGDRPKVLSPFITAGFPLPEWTVALVKAMADAGADMVEIGLPFSDPLADGPVIQHSSQIALESGMTVRQAIDIATRVRKETDLMINLMTYFNPVLSFGPSRFLDHAADAGVDGLIIPDLPPAGSENFYDLAQEAGLCPVHLLAPNTTPERVKTIDQSTRGFIYLVSVTGITGVRPGISSGLGDYLDSRRQSLKSPFLVGFGISDPEEAGRIGARSDGVIIGSRIIKIVAGSSSCAQAEEDLTEFIGACRQALDRTEGV
ncbi:tryptophan synthase subunit alpha [candidate division KSB1 bacterium]